MVKVSPSQDANNMSESTHGEPYDGMMCLATMEDITLEDANYGRHPADGSWQLVFFLSWLTDVHLCLFAVEYQGYPSLRWKPALYERSVIEQLLADQFHQFVERVKTTDCQAELRRLLADGPPVYISDKHALPLEEGDTHIIKLWFAGENIERDAKLEGAVEGEEREELWEELKQFIIVEGKEEGDDDDGDAKTDS